MENFKADDIYVESFNYSGPTEEEERAQEAYDSDLESSVTVQSIDRVSSIRYAYNESGKDKEWGDYTRLTEEFKDTVGDLESVRDHVSSGHALCAGNLNGKRREKSNFVGSQWILIDIDNTGIKVDEFGNEVKGPDGKAIKVYKPDLTIEKALNHEFVKAYCSLIYTSYSHSEKWHRFRLVFLLPEFVTDAKTYEAAVLSLMHWFPADDSCKESVRVFYGASNASFPLINPDVCLPSNFISEAKSEAKRREDKRAVQLAERKAKHEAYKASGFKSNGLWDQDKLIEGALSCIPEREVGSNSYQESLQVLQALHSHYGDAGISIAESWSPSQPGTTWDVAYKFNSFRKSGIEIATLFHIAKKYGFTYPEGFKNGVPTAILNLRIASDETQKVESWFNPNGPLYASMTNEKLKLRANILNGNIVAYSLISTQLGGLMSPKLACSMKIGERVEIQRAGGHVLVAADTGMGKTAITDLIDEPVSGLGLYASYQAEIITYVASCMVSLAEIQTKKGMSEDGEDQAKSRGELVICKDFSTAVRHGGQNVHLSGGNAVAFSAHSALSAKVYRESSKFWNLYRECENTMVNFNAYYQSKEFHNPGLVFYNRDAIAEMEKFAGTEFSSNGEAIGIMLAGFSTEDTQTYSRGNTSGGSGNAKNPLSRFTFTALTQPSVRETFIKKDIAMGGSKYGLAPRMNFLYIENTEKQDKDNRPKAVGIDEDTQLVRGGDETKKTSSYSKLSYEISEAIQRIGNIITDTNVPDSTVLSVKVNSDAAKVYEDFRSWIDEVDPTPNRYSKDRLLKIPQHFTKICLNVWLMDLLDKSIGKVEDDIYNIFAAMFKTGINEEQAQKAITLMKLHYVEHMIDGVSATSLSSIEGEDSPEGKVTDYDVLKAICENRNTLLQWFGAVKESLTLTDSKIIEKSVSAPILKKFQRETGKTLANVIKIAQAGKQLNLNFN